MLTPELRHRHSWQAGDGEKIRYSDLEWKPAAWTAGALLSATTTIDVSAATAPSVWQVLTATDSTHATWQTLAWTGTVTTVSVVSANGVSGTVANPTSTPAITLALGNITPTNVSPSAGTTSQAPIVLTAGSLLSTPVAWALEYDWTDLYFSF